MYPENLVYCHMSFLTKYLPLVGSLLGMPPCGLSIFCIFFFIFIHFLLRSYTADTDPALRTKVKDPGNVTVINSIPGIQKSVGMMLDLGGMSYSFFTLCCLLTKHALTHRSPLFSEHHHRGHDNRHYRPSNRAVECLWDRRPYCTRTAYRR